MITEKYQTLTLAASRDNPKTARNATAWSTISTNSIPRIAEPHVLPSPRRGLDIGIVGERLGLNTRRRWVGGVKIRADRF